MFDYFKDRFICLFQSKLSFKFQVFFNKIAEVSYVVMQYFVCYKIFVSTWNHIVLLAKIYLKKWKKCTEQKQKYQMEIKHCSIYLLMKESGFTQKEIHTAERKLPDEPLCGVVYWFLVNFIEWIFLQDWVEHVNTVDHTAACRDLRNKWGHVNVLLKLLNFLYMFIWHLKSLSKYLDILHILFYVAAWSYIDLNCTWASCGLHSLPPWRGWRSRNKIRHQTFIM